MKQFFFLLLALFFVFPPAVNAQSDSGIAMMPVPPDKPSNFFGQNHYYTITLRGNGEAVVTFKSILSNTGTSPMATVSLHLPENISPADIIAYQVIQQPQCIRYLPKPLPDVKTQTTPTIVQETCAEYQEPNYQYLYGQTTYKRIQNETQNNTILLQLPEPIAPNKNGSYFVYYRTKAVIQKDIFGAFEYKFVTLKTDDKIRSLQVGISADADYLFKGAKADINYSTPAVAAMPLARDSIEQGVSSPQFDQFYNQIGYGTITKQATDMAPLETFEVKGMYADSQAKLYGKEIATGIGVILFFVIFTFVLAKIILKRLSGKKSVAPEEAVVQLRQRNKTFLLALSLSFISMLFVCLYTFGIYAVTQLLNPNMYYGYSNNDGILAVFVFAVSSLVYLFFFFAPSLGMGLKKGWSWALVTFSATVVWAVLFLLVLFAVLLFFSPRNDGFPKPYPVMSTMEGRAAPAMDLPAMAPADPPATEPQTMQSQPETENVLRSNPAVTTEEIKPLVIPEKQ